MAKTIPTISKNIKKLRKAKDLSQDKLSRLADVSHSRLLKLNQAEYKARPLILSKKSPKALGVSLDDLMK